MTRHAARDPEAAGHEQHCRQHRAQTAPVASARGHGIIRAPRQQHRAMHGQHHHAQHACKQGERHEQLEEVPFVDRAQRHGIERERHAQHDVAHRHAEHQRRHHTREAQHGVPAIAPARAFHLAAVLEAHRPQDQRQQDQHHRQVKARERGGIEQGPRGKDGAARGD